MRYSNAIRVGRRGFTLIELLVVISIIAVLAALTASAVFRVQASQTQKRTETTVKKIQTALNAQWQAVISDVKDEIKNKIAPGAVSPTGWYSSANPNVLFLADGDPDRANVLWLKMRLLQEFPTNFAEAGFPVPATQPVTGYVKAKGAYTQYLAGATYTTALGFNFGGVSVTADQQSAICLYMALTLARRGATFNADDIGQGATKTLTFGGGTQYSFSVFIDGWGTPITYERWTTDSLILPEMANVPYVSAAAIASGATDLQDPLNKTLGWNTANTNAAKTLLPNGLTNQNNGPVVRAWGKDKAAGTNDDILGFRLMIEGQRGN